MGLPDSPHNDRADVGNVVHKALELLALKKFSEQEGLTNFSEDETGGKWEVKDFTPDMAFEAGWNLYKKKSPQWEWDEKTYKQARKWTEKVLTYNDGMFSPLQRTIVKPEQYFDFPIEEDWAKFSFENPWSSEPITGQLRVRGTMDLIVDMEWMPDAIEYIDWKTGKYARQDWKKRRVKGYKEICDDMQLRLYHLAIRRLFPTKKHIHMSIFYVQAGGPYSIPLDDYEIPKTLEKLKKIFLEMKESTFPKRISPDFKCSWCSYARENWKDSGKTVCDFMFGELKQLGLTKLYEKYADPKAGSTYTGGGRANVAVEEAKP